MATIIEMPKLSDTMSVGTLISWLKKEGEKVSSGDRIAEVETDKATMEMEIFEDGVLLKQFAAAGEQVAVGDPICAIGEKGEEVQAPAKKEAPPPEKQESKEEKKEKAPESKPAEPPKEKPKAADAPAPKAESVSGQQSTTSPAPKSAAPGERIRISPLARKLAEEKGIDPADIRGTGPNGRIVKADVEAAAKAPPAARSASGTQPGVPATDAKPPFVGTADVGVQEETSLPVSNMRGAIARRLVESKTQIPHFYVEIDVDAGPMMKLRQQVNEAFGEGSKVSINDFVIKACAHALRQVPEVNRSWEGESIKAHAGAHISFAVAIEDGLITPVIFDAHAKSIFEIAREARALGGKAKARKLQPNEFTGGTFCVSNLGMFGIPRFTAIINPPNAAILAVGATEARPVVNEQGQIVAGQQMALTLACDHRVVDGATGARFLAAVKDILEKPLLVLG